MKTSKIIIVMALALLLSLTGCELESSDNGKLDGMWHLETVDTLGRGRLDCKDMHLYWAFQKDLMQTSNSETNELIIYRFSHTGDSLVVWEPRVNQRDLGDTLITDISILSKYGINHSREAFHVDKLSGSQLELSTDTLRLALKKF
jgi:hypothetical protein